MPKLVGIRERKDEPIQACAGCGVVIAFVCRIEYKCTHCKKTFCKECFAKHDALICKILHR